MNKKVSIIVPCYNSEKFLRYSLNSIINQIYKNLEIIIIDDSSTDRTKELIKKYSSKDERIIPFYSERNKGVSHARNIGLRVCTGDYVMFVDSDDIISKNAVEILLKKAMDKNVELVDSNLIYYYKANSKIYKFTKFKQNKEDRLLNKIFNISVNGKLFKKSVLKDIYFKENLLKYENIDFLNKVLKNVNEYLFVSDLIYTFNQIPNSLINTLGVDNLCFIESLKKINLEKFDVNTINDEFLYVMFQKVLKNNKNIDENYIIINENLEKFIGIVGYDNLKKTIKKIKRKLKNEKKSKKILKKVNNIDLTNLYFKHLHFKFKYREK